MNTQELESKLAAVEKERDEANLILDYLIENSYFDNRDDIPIVLIVTEKAVKSCAGTWRKDYKDAVKHYITDQIQSARKAMERKGE